MTYHNLSAHSQKGNKHFIMENITNLLVALEWLVVFENIIFIGRSSKACLPRFYWDDCKIYCPYPFFGSQCKGKCDCRPNLCHHLNGCPSLISKHYQFKNMYLIIKTITFDSFLLYSRHTMTLHKGVEYNVSYFKSCAQYKHINDYSKIN